MGRILQGQTERIEGVGDADIDWKIRRWVAQVMEETKLTQTEAGAHRLMMQEHKAKRCHRCCGRHDLKTGGYICGWGKIAREQMTAIKLCDKFMLNEDRGDWLS